MNKRKVLFVGSFKSSSTTGHVGGQMYACNSLINSDLSEKVDWILLDTTAATNKTRSFLSRVYSAFKRMIKFIYHLLFSRPDSVLLFCSRGWSFKEKSSMAKIAKRFGKQVLLAPRSGLIKDDVAQSTTFKKFLIETFNHIDVLVCQGPSWKTYYSALSENDKLQYAVIHNWINHTPYTNIQKTSFTSTFNVLFLGWITKNKGVFDIIEAAKLLKTRENISFQLAGNGDAYDDIQNLIDKNNLNTSVKLLGWQMNQNKMNLLSEADVFILPSYREGYPNALIEAMASKTPVISTTVGSIPDLIKNGKNGFLITPGDYVKLLENIRILASDNSLRKQMAEEGQTSVLKNNSLKNAITKFEEIL